VSRRYSYGPVGYPLARRRMGRQAAWLCALIATAAAADPMLQTFQPDFFGTNEALQRRTPGLTAPFGRVCELPTEPISVSRAIDVALCRNPNTRAAWAAAHQQAAALGAAESAWLPDVGATGSLERSFGPHQDESGLITSSDQTTRDAAVNLTWTLYDFGNRDGRIRSARHLLDAAAATASSITQQTISMVVQNYYSVLAADAGLAAAQTTEDTAKRSWDIAKALREGGIATLADVLQSETAYEEAELTRVQAAQTVQTSRGALSVVMGLPANQPLKLAAETMPAQMPALSARMEDLMAEALRQRPDLAAARAEVDAAIADITVARAAGRPSISVGAGRTYLSETPIAGSIGPDSERYSQVGINITVPLFSGFSVGYGVRQAQAALQSRQANADQIRLNVSLDVWNAYYALDSANQQLSTTSTLVTTAESNQDVAVGRYQAGVGTIIDLLTAQTAAASARQFRITSELSWRVARAQLALALGRLTSAQPLISDGNALP
jgi:outer membrane protein